MELREGGSGLTDRNFCGLGRLLFPRFPLNHSEWHSDRNPSALDRPARETNSFAVKREPSDSCGGVRRRTSRRGPAQRAWTASIFSWAGFTHRRLEGILSRDDSAEVAAARDCAGGCRIRVMPFRKNTSAGLSDYGFVSGPLFWAGDLRPFQYW